MKWKQTISEYSIWNLPVISIFYFWTPFCHSLLKKSPFLSRYSCNKNIKRLCFTISNEGKLCIGQPFEFLEVSVINKIIWKGITFERTDNWNLRTSNEKLIPLNLPIQYCYVNSKAVNWTYGCNNILFTHFCQNLIVIISIFLFSKTGFNNISYIHSFYNVLYLHPVMLIYSKTDCNDIV